MTFNEVSNKVDFVELEHDILKFWRESDAFNKLRQLRKGSEKIWSFVDGPITANNPMGVHHAWGRTYKDLYNRYHAMQGKELRWQQGFDCQGLWVEVEVEKELGFKNKHDIEKYGLDKFITLCKQRVLKYAGIQTHQSIRLGYWMDWNDLDQLEFLREKLGEDPQQIVTVQGPEGEVTDTVEQIVGQLGLPIMGGSYFTFSNPNNYLIWQFLKTCHERGYLYKGRDVMPWCARCGTGISQHEIVTDGYKEITHETVFVKFPIIRKTFPQTSEVSKTSEVSNEVSNEALLVWTTTPWTLTSNVAAAVGTELTYAKVKQGDMTYYLAKDAMKNTLIGKYELVGELKGEEMLGWEYEGPFDGLPAFSNATSESNYTHRVIEWKEVGAEEGTGIVHIAPGCGAEDFALSKEHNLPIIAPLDENGVYLDGFDWMSGQSVFEVNAGIFDHLRDAGKLYRKQKYSHRYPHCWRCANELVYRLVDEWFISMGELYDKPRDEVTETEKAASLRYQIMDRVDAATWHPSFGRDREMDWLRNMHDWMISKKRYWGLALPIWEFEDGSFHVVGSADELEEMAVEGWDKFKGHTPHRPHIDEVKIRHPHKPGLVGTRIKDVGNPWLDAGIVALSTLQYDDKDYWNKWYPADFISESFPGQFRNWFYSLLAQSTVLAEEAPFKNLFSYATLLAEDGREMHKSWGNSIEFNEAADQMGADTMRWLYASCKPEKDLRFGYNVGDETRRRFLIPLWNVYSFLVTYADLDSWKPTANVQPPSPNAGNAQLDQWIVERLDETTLAVRSALDEYNSERATEHLEAMLDDLSNWYVRRSRRRFWKSEADADKQAAYATLYHVMVEFVKLLAPFIPFITESIYQNLVRSVDANAPESLHHTLYPAADAKKLDQALLNKMRLAITTASLGRSARSSVDIKLRQPLAKARVFVGNVPAQQNLRELADVLMEEINVKEIEVVSEVGELVSYKLLPNNRLLGPKFGKQFPQVRAELAKLEASETAEHLLAGNSVTLNLNGESVTLTPDEVLVETESKGALAVVSDKGVTVAVDTVLTAELRQEGIARDFIRGVNTLRSEMGLALDDRIEVTYQTDEAEIGEALANFASFIQDEVLAVALNAGNLPADAQSVKVGGKAVLVEVETSRRF